MMTFRVRLFWFILLVTGTSWITAADRVPHDVTALWSDYDPRAEPLEAKVVREWEKDGIVFRYVTYRIGTFKDQPAWMAGYFAFLNTQSHCRAYCICTAADNVPSCTRWSSTQNVATPACRSIGAAAKWRMQSRVNRIPIGEPSIPRKTMYLATLTFNLVPNISTRRVTAQ